MFMTIADVFIEVMTISTTGELDYNIDTIYESSMFTFIYGYL